MSTFQAMISVVLLIFVLSVIVQWIQEILKAALNTKASVMEETLDKFMSTDLTRLQITDALSTRGLPITALEHFDSQDFRHLLDGIELPPSQTQNIVKLAQPTVEQIKDNIAAAYEGARAVFQKAYATRNKEIAIGLSFLVVVVLNANLLSLYQQVSVDS